MAGLVDGNTERRQSGQVHEQVVDEIAETGVVVTADDGAKGDTVLTAQGVVRDKGVQAAVLRVGKVLAAFHDYGHLQIAHALLEPLGTCLVASIPQEGIDLVLMGYTLEPRHEEARHPLGLGTQFALQNIVNVNCLLCNLLHLGVRYTNELQS